jgi:hypothetical protein
MDIGVIHTSWIRELERINTELELLSPPKSNKRLDIDEMIAYARKHYEEHKEEHNKISQELQMILKDIAAVYASTDEKSRIRIRACFKAFRKISYSMESFPYGAREDLKTTQDIDIFRFGLIVASMQDQAIDCRDWSLSVSALIGRAAAVGIDVNPVLQEVADMSDPEKHEHAFWTTRDAFLRFTN